MGVHELVGELARPDAELVQPVLGELPEALQEGDVLRIDSGHKEGLDFDVVFQPFQQVLGARGQAELPGRGDVGPGGILQGQEVAQRGQPYESSHHDGGVGAVPAPAADDSPQDGGVGGCQVEEEECPSQAHDDIAVDLQLLEEDAQDDAQHQDDDAREGEGGAQEPPHILEAAKQGPGELLVPGLPALGGRLWWLQAHWLAFSQRSLISTGGSPET